MTIELATSARAGAWLADPGFGVYVHIPFCRHRCHYCDFNTYEGLDALHAPYVDALVSDIENASGSFPSATSVFFGGGTPTLLAPEALNRILDAVRNRVGLVSGAEITIEANPETVNEATFAALLDGGFNRFSVGVQSLVPSVLVELGRTHSNTTALDAIRAARAAGVEDINADLIYGSVWETDAHWRETLEGIIEASPDHISAYALTVEEGTPLATMVNTGRIADVDPDIQADRHALASELLGAAGYERYEISNWAHPSRACRHNLLYWSSGDYLGIGAGAHGHEAGFRYWRERLPRAYIDSVVARASTIAGSETVPDRAGEALMLGIRLRSGIDVSTFVDRFGDLDDRKLEIESLRDEGLLDTDESVLRLTDRATMLCNEVSARLM